MLLNNKAYTAKEVCYTTLLPFYTILLNILIVSTNIFENLLASKESTHQTTQFSYTESVTVLAVKKSKASNY